MENFIQVVRLGADAELRYTKDQVAIASFNGAYNTGFGDSQKTNWVRCSLFGTRAEKLAPSLTKGREVAVSGEIGLDEYIGTDKQQKARLGCRVSNLALFGKKDDSKPSQSVKQKTADPVSFDDVPEDIPF
jgi:single-strand DNA-binding protein